MKRNFIRGLLGLALLTVSGLSVAEDIDLFVKNEGSGAAANVLLVLDNGANFSSTAPFPACEGEDNWPTNMLNTTGGIEQCALYKVVKALEPDAVNLGVMIFNGNVDVAGCEGGSGGCLAYPVTPMTVENKTAVLAWIKTWKTSGSGPGVNLKSNSNKNGAVMQEAWALFAGRTGLSGRNYASLMPGATCGNNYVIFVGNAYTNNGTPNEGGSASPKAALEGTLATSLMNASPVASALQKATMSGPIPVSCEGGGSFVFSSNNHESNGYYADEWARYMKSQGITTYAVGLMSASCKQSYEALLQNMSEGVGGGKFFKTHNFNELKTAFEAVLSEIQSVNSVFASVSLPVSVNTQGTFLNQVFVGMFRPDEQLGPRWFGNLKQYKLGYIDNQLKLLDADDAGAISSGDSGFISENARSFWTPPKTQSLSTLYWADLTVANSIGYLPQSETPDGNMVEKGGQGYKLRGITPTDRKVLTCGASCTSTLASFNTSNTAISKTALGNDSMSDTAREDLINWTRGLNVDAEAIANSTLDAEGNVTQKTTAAAKLLMRPSSHGDVVHSRPVAINFAAPDIPTQPANPAKVVVFYGGNDGMLRAVNGNRDDGVDVGGKGPGEELWSFIAPESYGMLARLKADSPSIKYPSVTTGNPKDYGFDGPVTAYKSSSAAWVFATMRRGGRMLYAFDVPDSNPANPTLKWRIGCPNQANDTDCTTGFSGMGQTWAVPTVLKSAGYVDSGVNKPMLIMGGGYDRCEDADPASCTSDSKGRAIYLLDAETGARLKAFATTGSVIGDVTVIKDSAGLATYAYAADLSGNVYRISGGDNAPIGNVAPASWVITKIASLGGTGTSARKFMFGPDVVVDGGVHYLLLGSGDREKPVIDYKNASAVQNHFFMLQDQPLNSAWLTGESANCSGSQLLCLNSLLRIENDGVTPAEAEFSAKKGWYLELDSSEKVVTAALTIFGTVYFSTHQPDQGLVSGCSAKLGESRGYSINFKSAEGLNGERYVDLVGDGLPPSPVAGLVTLDNDTTVPFCIGCGDKPLEGTKPKGPPSTKQPKARVYWNVEQ